VVPRPTRGAGGSGQRRARTVLPAARVGEGTFSGWLGVFLDLLGPNSVDWSEIAAIIEDAYRIVAPRQLIAELDGR
jgi:hypothetical protein